MSGRLSLYYYDACPFCRIVLREIERLGLEVERRDIWMDRQHRTDLVEARGRSTVPVLRIEGDDGEAPVWMPESADIIEYLRTVHTAAG